MQNGRFQTGYGQPCPNMVIGLVLIICEYMDNNTHLSILALMAY